MVYKVLDIWNEGNNSRFSTLWKHCRRLKKYFHKMMGMFDDCYFAHRIEFLWLWGSRKLCKDFRYLRLDSRTNKKHLLYVNVQWNSRNHCPYYKIDSIFHCDNKKWITESVLAFLGFRMFLITRIWAKGVIEIYWMLNVNIYIDAQRDGHFLLNYQF